MRELVILFVHAIATLARLLGPGGIRSALAESVLVKQQLLILNRSRQRSPNLRTSDRLVAGLCALLIRPARLIRSAIVLRPSTPHQDFFSSQYPQSSASTGVCFSRHFWYSASDWPSAWLILQRLSCEQ